MSVRSFFRDIARPQQGESVTYQKGGLVTSIKAMKIKGSLGEGSEVLASDGAGGIEWRALESGGGGLVPSLAEVMGVGGTAGADLDMGEFDITKSSQLCIDAPLISLSGTVSFEPRYARRTGNVSPWVMSITASLRDSRLRIFMTSMFTRPRLARRCVSFMGTKMCEVR